MERVNKVVQEISDLKNNIRLLQEILERKEEELISVCPHENMREELDDDFHRPHFYLLCLTCNQEFDINYKRNKELKT